MPTAERDVLTHGELLAELDRRTREQLGISAAEFVARLRAGEAIDADPVIDDLAFLARLVERAEGQPPARRDEQRLWHRLLERTGHPRLT